MYDLFLIGQVQEGTGPVEYVAGLASSPTSLDFPVLGVRIPTLVIDVTGRNN
jgi:hypothetical protein